MTGRFARLVLAAAFAVAGTVAPAMSAEAAPASACSSSTGVLVVVDFRPFGGDITRGCASTPTTGRAALEAVTSDIVEVQRQPGFVCRIAGRPANDPCINTPPASAYWSYWHADAGQQSWSYSSRGASSTQPKDGSIDAWVFGATDVGGTSGGPCFSPADVRTGRATACTSAPTAPKPTRSTASRAPKRSAPETAARPTTSGARASATPSRPANASTAVATPATASSSAVASSPATSPVTPPAIVDASPAAGDRKDDGGGSALPVVLGLALVLLIGGAAAWTMRRRRAEADGS